MFSANGRFFKFASCATGSECGEKLGNVLYALQYTKNLNVKNVSKVNTFFGVSSIENVYV